MEEQKQQQEEGNKVEKKFEANMKKIMAVFNGDNSIFKQKVSNSSVANIAAELLKENTEEAEKSFKEEIKKIISSKVAFDKFVAEKKREMNQAIKTRMEEFNKMVDATFQRLEDANALLKAYSAALGTVPKVEEDTEEKE